MTDFLDEIFEWSGKFDDAVAEARNAGKKTISIKAPKNKNAREMNVKVVEKMGHVITNPKSKGNWKITIDSKKNELRDIKITTISMK